MKTDTKKDNGIVEKRKFVIDPEFIDPLLAKIEEDFDEIEVEEIPYYYEIHLGIKPTMNDNS